MPGPRILAACTGGGVGDLLAAIPAIQALRRHFDIGIDVMTTPYAAPVLEGQASVAEVLTDDGRQPLRQLVGQIASRHYSHAVVFWSNPRIAKAVALAAIPTRVGQARRLYSFRYTKRVGVRSEVGDTHSHWTDIQMDYARALGVSPAPQDYRIELCPRPEDDAAATRLVADTVLGSPFIIFHAARGISARTARWPSEHLAAIADALSTAFDMPVMLTGSAEEAGVVGRVAAAMRHTVFDVSARTTLLQFGSLARASYLVVALDSGPMHIAASVGAPTVGIFALRSDFPDRWRPLGARVAVVQGHYPCPPRCRKETCRTFACYAALAPHHVVECARGLLGCAAPVPH